MGRNKKDLSEKGTQRVIPLIVEKSIQYIEQHGLSTEGIFRISANKSDYLRIKKMFDKGKNVDFEQENISPHVCAELLKSYFREMAEPLLTLDAHNYFIVLFDQPESVVKGKIKAFLPLLPAPNRSTLQYLISFLRKVAEKAETNKMTVANLAIVFTPNIIRTVDNTSLSSSSLNFVVEAMISHYDSIFQGYDAGDITVKLKRVRSADNLKILTNGEKGKADTSRALISPRRSDHSPSRISNPLSANSSLDAPSPLSPQFIASLQKFQTNQPNATSNTPVNTSVNNNYNHNYNHNNNHNNNHNSNNNKNSNNNNTENQSSNARSQFDQLLMEWQKADILKNDQIKYHRELRNNMKNINYNNNNNALKLNHSDQGEAGSNYFNNINNGKCKK